MMGPGRLCWGILCVAAVVQTGSTSNVADSTTHTPAQMSSGTAEAFAWGAWGAWSQCSRTCGGGVSSQERKCVSRTSNSSRPVAAVRVTRDADRGCEGEWRRYRECNVEPCKGSARSIRAEQCAVFDRKPFRGRFYTWVPYIDGSAPCVLHCRPLGQVWYAALGAAADGTPCTRPGHHARCRNGRCQVIGADVILADSPARSLRCGSRLVSGLFSRARLPLGYSRVATVPRGACRLNVTEMQPTDNYIALKIANGSYIMNGEFAVSSPGAYEAAGARFVYTRAGGRDHVYAAGPVLEPIEIMILYTKPKPNIKYEYFTESLNSDIDSTPDPEIPPTAPKHTRRHHNYLDTYQPKGSDLETMSKELEDFNENVVGEKTFIWKIVSYSQCTRTCGGGMQVGKYRCVESSTSREVSPAHCSSSPPLSGRRRRCGVSPCPPRWRARAWSACPACGPAQRTRIVGCVQDHSRGITKISDSKCPPDRPPSTEQCNIPPCVSIRPLSRPSSSAGGHTDSFRDGPVYTMDAEGPHSFSDTAGWLVTDWSQCVGGCASEGVQSRGVRCADPAGCDERRAPPRARVCRTRCDPHRGEWLVGEWSACSSSCAGRQVRAVLCAGAGGALGAAAECVTPPPPNERACAGDCAPTWYYSHWGKCGGKCGAAGYERRSVVCAPGAGPSAAAPRCVGPPPRDQRECQLNCSAVTDSPLPPTLTIESQKGPEYEIVVATTTTTTPTTHTPATAKTPEGDSHTTPRGRADGGDADLISHRPS